MNITRFVGVLALCALFGAGCPFGRGSSTAVSDPDAVQESMRAPAPAKSPTEQPKIPKEAEKVPRPY